VTAIADYLAQLPQPELDALWDEAEQWTRDAVLPPDAGMRSMITSALGVAAGAVPIGPTWLSTGTTAVYREAAVRARKALAEIGDWAPTGPHANATLDLSGDTAKTITGYSYPPLNLTAEEQTFLSELLAVSRGDDDGEDIWACIDTEIFTVGRILTRLAEAAAIVAELASEPVTAASEIDGTPYCALCNHDAVTSTDLDHPSAHEPDCLWLRAAVLAAEVVKP
jgi:hypothetical protein